MANGIPAINQNIIRVGAGEAPGPSLRESPLASPAETFFLKVCMQRDPAFLFYPDNFIGGTHGWTRREKGAYLDLLLFQFQHGPFTEDAAMKFLAEDKDLWEPCLKDKFKGRDGIKYYNTRLKLEFDKRNKYCTGRKKNADHPKTKKHMHKHMESICTSTPEIEIDHDSSSLKSINTEEGIIRGPEEFEEFWIKYPNKKDKGFAREAWFMAVKKTAPNIILNGLRDQLPAMHDKIRAGDGRYIQKPQRWLEAEGWVNLPDIEATPKREYHQPASPSLPDPGPMPEETKKIINDTLIKLKRNAV